MHWPFQARRLPGPRIRFAMPDLVNEACVVSSPGAKIDEESSYTVDVAVAFNIRSSSFVGLLSAPSSYTPTSVRSASRGRTAEDLLKYKIPPAGSTALKNKTSHSTAILLTRWSSTLILQRRAQKYHVSSYAVGTVYDRRFSENLGIDIWAGSLEYAQSECESLFKGVADVLVCTALVAKPFPRRPDHLARLCIRSVLQTSLMACIQGASTMVW